MLSVTLLTVLTCLVSAAHARDQVRAVGSSTVYPFITLIAEQFGRSGKFPTPIVEPAGTGIGIDMFCKGVGEAHPDIANASRPMTDAEKELCAANGVTSITEFQIGLDGVVVANAVNAPGLSLTTAHLFKALAKQTPENGKLVTNPYKTWKQVDASLPDTEIKVYGPPPSSGTRDIFVEKVFEPHCMEHEAFKTAYPDEKERKTACHQVREDTAYVEAGENDNLIVQKVMQSPDSIGIFGYSFLCQNTDLVKAITIDGIVPGFDTISKGEYAISRPLYLYVKNAHVGLVPGLKEFALEFSGDAAVGEEGYTTDSCLVPLRPELHEEYKHKAESL